jgi:hypothetical protein
MYQRQPVITPRKPFQTSRPEPTVQRIDTTAKECGRVAGLVKSLNALEGEELRPSFRESQTGSWRRPSGSNDLQAPTVPITLAHHKQTTWRPSPYHVNDGAAPDHRQVTHYGITSTPPSPGHTQTPDRPNPFRRRDSSGSEIAMSPAPRRDSLSRKAFERVRTLSPPMVPEDQPYSPAPYHHRNDTIESYIFRQLSEQWSPTPGSVSSVVHTPRASPAVDAPPSTPCPVGHVDTPFALDILRNIDHILSDHTAALRAVISCSEKLLQQNEQHCQLDDGDHAGKSLGIPKLASAASEPPTLLKRRRSSNLRESSSSASVSHQPRYAPNVDLPPRTLTGSMGSIPALVQMIDDTVSSFDSNVSRGDPTDLSYRKPVLSRRPAYRSSNGRDTEPRASLSHTPSPPFRRPRSSKSGSIAITPPRIRVARADQPLQAYDLVPSSAFASLPAAPISPPTPSPQPFITLVHPALSPPNMWEIESMEPPELSMREESPPLIEYDRDAALADRVLCNRASLVDLTAITKQSHLLADSLPILGQCTLGFPGQPCSSPSMTESHKMLQSVDVEEMSGEYFPQRAPKIEDFAEQPFPTSPNYSCLPTTDSLPPPSKKKPTRTVTTKPSKSVRGAEGTMRTTRPTTSSTGTLSGLVAAPTMMSHETQSRVKNAKGFWAKDGGTKARNERPWFQKRGGEVGSEQSAGRGSSSMG